MFTRIRMQTSVILTHDYSEASVAQRMLPSYEAAFFDKNVLIVREDFHKLPNKKEWCTHLCSLCINVFLFCFFPGNYFF